MKKSRTKASVSREAVPLPIAMARTLYFAIRALQSALGAGDVVLRLVRIDDVVGEELAGLVDHGDLAAGADAGVDAEHGELAGGRGEQQVLRDSRGTP